MTPSSVADPACPSIPRYGWLKRIIAVTGSVLFLLVIVRLAWGWDANRQLRSALAEIRARGEPIDPADFVLPNVPDDQNYVTYLEKALAAVDPKAMSPSQSDMEYQSYPPYTPQWYAMAKAAMEASPNALKLAREARAHPRADWRTTYTTPIVSNIYDRRLTSARNLANLISDTALYQHLQGNDAEAIELIMDVLAMADATHASPSLLSHLVGTGLDSLASRCALLIAPALRVEGVAGSDADRGLRPASRERVRLAIERFLDDRHADSLGHAVQFERMLILDTMRWYTKDSLVLHPMYTLDTLVILKRLERSIDAMNRDPIALVRRNLPPPKLIPTNLPGFGPQPKADIRTVPRELSSEFSLSPVSALRMTLERRADDLMAAVSLAMAMYRADHNGNWPDRLDALVPAYLPAVPIDPFSKPQQPLRYVVVNESTRPIVYSIGTDGVDSTAAGATIPPEPQADSDRTPDLWRDLSRLDPLPAQSQ